MASNQYGRGQEERRDIAAEQRKARLEDLNASTRPSTVTVAELRGRRR